MYEYGVLKKLRKSLLADLGLLILSDLLIPVLEMLAWKIHSMVKTEQKGQKWPKGRTMRQLGDFLLYESCGMSERESGDLENNLENWKFWNSLWPPWFYLFFSFPRWPRTQVSHHLSDGRWEQLQHLSLIISCLSKYFLPICHIVSLPLCLPLNTVKFVSVPGMHTWTLSFPNMRLSAGQHFVDLWGSYRH